MILCWYDLFDACLGRYGVYPSNFQQEYKHQGNCVSEYVCSIDGNWNVGVRKNRESLIQDSPLLSENAWHSNIN